MTNKEVRLNTLKAAGVDTGKFIAMDVPDGATIIIATPDGEKKYDKYGNPIDEILKKVEEVGFIKEDPHFRRWVMAQTFTILNSGRSYAEYIKYHKGGYFYQFDMTLNELEAITKLPVGSEARNIREKFFTASVVIGLCEDYLDLLKEYVDRLPERKHRGKPYKKVKWFGPGVHTKDIEGVVYAPLEKPLDKMKEERWRISTERLFNLFKQFVKHMVRFNAWDEKLYNPWLAAYQGEGAYYTAMGLVKFHGCRVYRHGCRYAGNEKKERCDLPVSIELIDAKVKEIVGNSRYSTYRDWYLMTGMLKEIIKDNKFNFSERMQEIYR